MAEYISNSHKSKSPVKADAKKKVERVTNGPVRKKKRSGIQKLADIFILEDVQSVKEIVCQDVLIPSIKKVVVDTAISSIDMLFNGETGRAKRGGSRTSYRDYYDSGGGADATIGDRNASTISRIPSCLTVTETRRRFS